MQRCHPVRMSTVPTPARAAGDRLDARELRAWRGLLRVHSQMSKALDAELEDRHDLALSSYEVLMSVADAPDERLRMHDLAERVLLSRSGLTRLVDRLVRDGYLERCACVDDARGQFACLTSAGREKLDAARRVHLEGVRRMFLSHFSDAEQEQLGAYWDRVLDT